MSYRAKVSVALRRAVRQVNLDLLRQQTGLTEAYFLQCFSDRAMATVHFGGQQVWSARQLTDSPFRQCLDAGTDSLQTALEDYLRQIVGLIQRQSLLEESPFAQADTAYAWLAEQQYDPRVHLLPTWEALRQEQATPIGIAGIARRAFETTTPPAEADYWQQRLLEHRTWLEKLELFVADPAGRQGHWTALVEAFAAHMHLPFRISACITRPPNNETDPCWLCGWLLYHFHFR